MSTHDDKSNNPILNERENNISYKGSKHLTEEEMVTLTDRLSTFNKSGGDPTVP